MEVYRVLFDDSSILHTAQQSRYDPQDVYLMSKYNYSSIRDDYRWIYYNVRDIYISVCVFI